MKNLRTLLLATVILSFVCASGPLAATNSIPWVSYEDAKKLADNSNKVFLYFYSTNCYYCALMEKNTFSDQKLATYLSRNFLTVKVNTDREKVLADNYNVRGNPTNYFLTEEFEVIGQLPGYLPPEDLLNILKYVHTGSFQKMTFEKFMEGSDQ